MKLIGSLENFQPASLLQWFQTERADGVLAIQGRPGYRLRFEGGEVVAAAHWPPGESFERRLAREIGGEQAAELRREAERRGVATAELAHENLGAREAAALVRSHTEGVAYRMLEETRGRFFFDPAAAPLPAVLRSPFPVSQILLEGALLQDEQGRLSEWIPPAESPLRLVGRPSAPEDSATGLSSALLDGLRELRSRQQLEEMIPAESHTVRLKLAELVRSGNVEIVGMPSVSDGGRLADGASTSGLLKLSKRPTADDWPFLTVSEAELMEELGHGPRSLDDASQSLRRDRRELLPAAELLADTNWIAVQDMPRPTTSWPRSLALGAVVGGALAALSFFLPWWTRDVGVSPPQAEAVEIPAAGGVSELPSRPEDPVASGAAEEDESEPAAEVPPSPVAPPSSAPVPPPPTAAALPPPAAATPPALSASGEAIGEAPRQAEITVRFEKELAAIRRAIEAGNWAGAEASLDRAAALRPGDERLSQLWREIRTASSPPPPPAATAASAMDAAEARPAGPARLVINSVPFGWVRIDGVEHGETPLSLNLDPGTYVVEVFRGGYHTTTRTIELESDTVSLEAFNLETVGEFEGEEP